MTQLHIRNEHGGMIWQVYNVTNQFEVDMLTDRSRSNGFCSQELVDANNDETWPGWREDGKGWQDILDAHKGDPRMDIEV